MTHEEIQKRIAEAPEPFRVELERLRRLGIIRADGSLDPEVRQAFLRAAEKVAEEPRNELAAQDSDESSQDQAVQNTPQKVRTANADFPKKPKQRN